MTTFLREYPYQGTFPASLLRADVEIVYRAMLIVNSAVELVSHGYVLMFLVYRNHKVRKLEVAFQVVRTAVGKSSIAALL